MKRLVVSVVLLAALLVCGVGAGLAAGPNDGVWLVTQGTGADAFQYFATIHENSVPGLNFNVLIGFMDPEFGFWTYALTLRSGNTVQGSIFDGFDALNPFFIANVSITFTSATTFTGTITENSVDKALTGQRLF